MQGLQIPVEGGQEPWQSNAKEDVHGITARNLQKKKVASGKVGKPAKAGFRGFWDLGEYQNPLVLLVGNGWE